MVQASVAEKYSPLAATYPIFPKPNTPTATPTDTATCQDVKRTTVTSEGGNNINANVEKNKKVKVVKTHGADKKKMGMFYLKPLSPVLRTSSHETWTRRSAWISPARKRSALGILAHSSTLVTQGIWIR